jgi:hypothetical protein
MEEEKGDVEMVCIKRKNTHRVLPTASFKLPGASYWGSKSTSVLRTLPQLKFINYMIKMFKN